MVIKLLQESMQLCYDLCKNGNECIKRQIMIIVDEFGRWKCIINLYVESQEKLDKQWLNGKLVCFAYLVYIVWKWYDMPPTYAIMILMDNRCENNKFGLEM